MSQKYCKKANRVAPKSKPITVRVNQSLCCMHINQKFLRHFSGDDGRPIQGLQETFNAANVF